MKSIIKVEELGMFLFSIFLFNQLNFSWWVYPLCFLLPDIGMLAYLINTKIGAMLYNLSHHKAIALFIYILGHISQNPILELSGVILFGHSSFDRMLGYGLKYADNFQHTHLGLIGK